MSPQRPLGRVHIIGAGPVGLLPAALLQEVEGQQVRLYERRAEYTRTRMVSLAKYLIADSVESYKEDPVDGQDVEALYDPVELQTRLAYRRAVAPDLRALLEEWSRGFVQLNVDREPADRADRGPRHRDRRAGVHHPHPRRGARAAWSRATCWSTARAPGR